MKVRLTNFIAAVLIGFTIPVSAAVLYVDANGTNATPPYADLTTAALNIQDAVNAATNGDLIMVNDGIYQEGYQTAIVYYSSGVEPTSVVETNRLVIGKKITVQSLNGPTATCISGSGMYRCVYMTNGSALIGFKLTNGSAGWVRTYIARGHEISVTNIANGGGVYGIVPYGGVGGMLTNCLLTGNLAYGDGGGACNVALVNCTLANNTAKSGGGAKNSILINSIIVGNSAQSFEDSNSLPAYPPTPTGVGGGLYAGSANNCLITNNSAYQGGGTYGILNLKNCTIINNSASGYGGISLDTTSINSYCHVTNCIIYYNTATTGNNFGTGNFIIDHSCTTPMPAAGLGNITNPPTFVDYWGGDFHLQSNSPCINAGYNAAVTNATDLDGNARIVGNTVDIGAYEYQSPASVLSFAWAQQYGLPTDGSADYADVDGDSMNNWQEWMAGTNPTNGISVLSMSPPVVAKSLKNAKVTWKSVSGRTYFIQRSTNLFDPSGFFMIQSNLTGLAGTTSFTDFSVTNSDSYFYRVGVQP